MKLLFDQLNSKNEIGKAISFVAQKGVKSSYIVSPYISKISDIIDLSQMDKIKIICNAKSNSCNPFTLYELSKKNKIQIKSRNDIHAKVYLFDDTAFITSANATPNGLGIGTIEVATEITGYTSVKKIQLWFNSLWQDIQSEDVAEFNNETWQKLKSNWMINNKNNAKPTLYDLLVTKNIPKNVSFTFWNEDDNVPGQTKVAKQAEIDNMLELPSNNDNWDFWIEEHDIKGKNKGVYELLEGLLQKYYNHTMINLKTHKNSQRVYHVDNFACKLLDKPIQLKWKNKTLILSLYRKDNVIYDFTVDNKAIELLNKSRVTNKKAWEQYRKTDDGKYGYCSRQQLYKLIKNCYL